MKKIIKNAIFCMLLSMLFVTPKPTSAKNETELSYIYNPEDIGSAKEKYEYVCSYTNSFDEKEYLFFNPLDINYSYHSGSYCGNYILNENYSIKISGNTLFIVEAKADGSFFDSYELEVYTDFTIQKLK